MNLSSRGFATPLVAVLAATLVWPQSPRAEDPVPDDLSDVQPIEAAAAADGSLPFQIDRGEGVLPLFVPRDETLVYRVDVAWGVIGAALGTVTLTTGVEP